MSNETIEYYNSLNDADSLAEALRRDGGDLTAREMQSLIARAISGSGMNSLLLKAMLPEPAKKKSVPVKKPASKFKYRAPPPSSNAPFNPHNPFRKSDK